jgi:8-oxo-dGTP diphosphatase
LPQTPLLTVDCVLFRGAAVLLIRRKNPPFEGHFALPGGFVEIGESVEDACRRETAEETGVTVTALRLIGVYSKPGRDPRRHTVSVAFLGEGNVSVKRAGDDAAGVELVEGWLDVPIAFDHMEIIRDAWRLQNGRPTKRP